jgi:hypothetical protein
MPASMKSAKLRCLQECDCIRVCATYQVALWPKPEAYAV